MKKFNEMINEKVTLYGFAEKVRNLQWVQFVILKDKTGKVQLTIEKSDEANKELVEIVNNLSLESTVKLRLETFNMPFSLSFLSSRIIADLSTQRYSAKVVYDIGRIKVLLSSECTIILQ